ncbi:MAG: hypothetical protein Q7R60_04395 [bacterium]|nr:hypothetical protein [bacterium]
MSGAEIIAFVALVVVLWGPLFLFFCGAKIRKKFNGKFKLSRRSRMHVVR